MPTGDFAAGVEPAGYDPVVPGTPRVFTTPAAVRFDGSARAFTQASDGTLTACHPVDQRMAFGLLVKRGTLRMAPTIGHRLHEITNLRGSDLTARVKDAVENAVPVNELLAAGDVVIDRIQHEVREHGGLAVFVYYRNLRETPDRLKVIQYPS